MATILVCSVPNPGHFNPMLTVALHVANQGHEVIVHTAEPFRLVTEGHGLRFIPFEGRANFDYHCFPDRSLLPDGPSRPNAMRDFLFSQPLADQFRSLARILDKHSIDVVLTDTLFYGVLPLLQTTDVSVPGHALRCGPETSVTSPLQCPSFELSWLERDIYPVVEAVGIVWSATRLQAESLSRVEWSAQMYPACLWSLAPGHNGVRASLVYKVGRT